MSTGSVREHIQKKQKSKIKQVSPAWKQTIRSTV